MVNLTLINGMVLLFGVFLGFLTTLTVLILLWALPRIKDIIRNINLTTKFRKEIPLTTIYCYVKDCKYINKDGKCEREIININTQVECESFERKNG